MGVEQKTLSHIPEAHTVDIRELKTGVALFSVAFLADRHRIRHPEVLNPYPINHERVSSDPNAHNKERIA